MEYLNAADGGLKRYLSGNFCFIPQDDVLLYCFMKEADAPVR